MGDAGRTSQVAAAAADDDSARARAEQRRAERYRALEATADDLDDEEDAETVLASLREARRTVAERRRARQV